MEDRVLSMEGAAGVLTSTAPDGTSRTTQLEYQVFNGEERARLSSNRVTRLVSVRLWRSPKKAERTEIVLLGFGAGNTSMVHSLIFGGRVLTNKNPYPIMEPLVPRRGIFERPTRRLRCLRNQESRCPKLRVFKH